MGQLRRVIVVLLAMFAGGTIAGVVQNAARDLEIAELREEIRQLSDSLRTCRHHSFGGAHPDLQAILDAANMAHVPAIVLVAVIEQETGTSGRYDLVGRHGEYGRAQIRYDIWRDFTPDCASVDRDSQLRCAAQILAYCRERYGDWRTAVACYNATAQPERGRKYLAAVEQRIGRMILEGL
jgi:hypothetical protein